MLLAILRKLLKPLIYLRIKHKQKLYIDLILPVIIGVVLTAIVFFSPVQIKLLGQGSLVGLVNGLLQILIGFFVASLAAVATFQREGLDEVMVGKAPTLRGEKITRRQFVCYMFGYLALVSIVLYFGGGITELTVGLLKVLITEKYELFKYSAIFVYLSVLANLVLTTMLALYYLTDRIIRDNTVSPILSEPEQE
ncbi:hypothetical protein DEB41_12285 [Vibrio anguillarum]|uniref:ABC transporter permease n=7 Tax=Vibrio anguillarum TaxID=55601 RepID=A0AAW4AKU7_VIBAN|nr:hypothetical protein [Vibrio anguillarum]AGU59008.1 hypothetical protein N175_13330 [Vibrio anguillarum M3]ASF90925.1 hypothetical protein CEA93_02330 [Vibrio anguillarum]ATA50401.1 hypothetical protein CLI14_11930 [Vibrio anguillarum]AVT68995.1 hypothetical protein B5S57_18035 [Vibrio anguillarum]AXN08234.1 hypothetical protein DEA53_12465 [Vibrio anguillarum]